MNSKCNLWNYKKAKWNLFRENLETLSKKRNFNYTEKKDWKSISKEITDEAVKYIPKVKKRIKNPVPYWNEECNEAIKERKRARRKVLKSKLPQDFIVYKQKKALGQKLLNPLRNNTGQHYCSSLNKNSNLNKIWKTVNKMKSHDNSNNNIPIIKVNNKENITDEQKAEVLANCFQSVCSDQNYMVSHF